MRSRFWLLPMLMLAWVNLHPGFIAGLEVIAAYVLLEATDPLCTERRQGALLRLRQAWPWLGACVAVTLGNPRGTGIYSDAFTLFGLNAPVQGFRR